MAPGGNLMKKKARYAPNHTSINSTPRRSARVQSDMQNKSAPNESNRILKNIEFPSNGPQTGLSTQSSGLPTQSTGSKNQSSNRQTKSIGLLNQPTGHRTQSTSSQNKSTGDETQTKSPQTPSTGQQKLATSPPRKSVKLKTPAPATPTESSGLQTNMVGYLLDEPDDNNQDAHNTQDTLPDEIDETVAVSSAEKRKRGPTMGRGLIRTIGGPNGKKLKIEVDPTIGRPKNRIESAKFSSEVGVMARDILPIPRKWKELDVQSALDPCFDHMQIHMELDLEKPGVKQSLIERLKNSSRQQRYRLHVHFKKFANVQEAKRNRPKSVTDQVQWELLCEHFDSEQFRNQSRANKSNRKQMLAKHVTGRTPFTIIQNEISRKNGKECDMIELYRSTHQNAKGKWSSEAAEVNWELMKESQLTYADKGIQITEREIVAEVLGTANGYIKGLGYGPKPPGKRNAHLQQLDETQAELQAQSDNAAYRSKIDAMTEQLKEQEAKIAKLMAFMESGGRSGVDEDDD